MTSFRLYPLTTKYTIGPSNGAIKIINNHTTLSVDVSDLLEMHLTKASRNTISKGTDKRIRIISADPRLIKFSITGWFKCKRRDYLSLSYKDNSIF